MKKPVLGNNVFIAEGAIVRGDVILKDDVNIWFNAVLRAERAPAVIGKGTNVQDNATVHVDEGAAVTIGENVTIGHNAIVHGCEIGDNTLVGMGSIIMNNAKIGKNCIIGAGALITQGKEIPDNSLAMGSPAKVIRQLSDEEAAGNVNNAVMYVAEAKEYMAEE